MPCCSTVSIPRRYLPTSQSNSSIPPEPPERNSCLLEKWHRRRPRHLCSSKTRTICFPRPRSDPFDPKSPGLRPPLPSCGIYWGYVGLTADATDPLRAFESLTPWFLVNATGTLTALFPDSSSQPAGAPEQKLPRFAPRRSLLVLPF